MSSVVRRRRRSVSDEVSGAFRMMFAGTALMATLTLTLLTWLTVVSEPREITLDRLVSAVEDAHVGLVDEETGLRAYLLTGESPFLDPYVTGRAQVVAADDRLQSVEVHGALSDQLLSFRLGQQAWTDGWATTAALPHTRADLLGADGQLRMADVSAYLARGKALMDAYRLTERRLVDRARIEASGERAKQRAALVLFCAVLLLIAIVKLVAASRRRSALRAKVVAPVTAMLANVRSVSAGDLRPVEVVDGAADLQLLQQGLADMTEVLARQHDAAELRAVEGARSTARLHEVLAFAREISGSLSVRYVLEALTAASSTLTGATMARVWLRGPDDELLHLAADSSAPRKATRVARSRAADLGTVGRAVGQGAVCRSSDAAAGADEAGEDEVIAVQLTVGARTIGALELVGAEPEALDEALALVETVAGHAATALEAARLYQEAQTLSVSDALTGLANRRSLDDDLRLEVERAIRYGRPVALIMVDLDHFKALNDTFGHQRGDVVLQQVGECLTAAVRGCDTVYRYGGEELAVIARDTDLASAQLLAERLRTTIASRFTSADGLTVTLSAGVAAVPQHAATPAGLIAAADTALYAAKAAGRNCTTVAVS